MARECFDKPTNPYHYALHCISGKWKMVILHEVYTFGRLKFNYTRKVLPITEKVLSQQLKELIDKGVQAAQATGQYVIIDWHILSDGNPAQHQQQSRRHQRSRKSALYLHLPPQPLYQRLHHGTQRQRQQKRQQRRQ